MTDQAPLETSTVDGHMVRGSAWMVGMRWTIRAIGLISTIILARLLTPADFGIVAMAMVVVGFLEVFTYTGVDLALIRDHAATKEHYDTAWTIEIIQGLLLGAVLLIIAPFAGSYFHEPRVVPVIQLLSLRAIIGGFQNIGVVAFRKDLNFAKEFRFGVYQKLLTFAVTVSLAFTFRSYWALVGGLITGRVMEVALSFTMHPYRPRLTFRHMRELWFFSQWMLVSYVGYFLNSKLDSFIVGGLAGTTEMGTYSVSSDLSTLPTNEIVMPLARGLFPTYSRLIDAPAELGAAFLRVTRALAAFSFAVGFGIAAVAQDFVAVVLGSQWHAAVPLVRILAIFGAVNGMAFSLQPLFTAVGKVRSFALFTWVQLAVLVPALTMAGQMGGIENIALARTLTAAAVAPFGFYMATRVSHVSIAEVVGAVWRPILSAFVMVAAVLTFHAQNIEVHIVTLLIDIATGAAVYCGSMFVLWVISGKPEGIERVTLDFANRRLGRAVKA